MIDDIKSLCEVQRNDGSKATIIEITKHDVKDVKQIRRHAEMDENQTDIIRGRILKFEIKALN